MKTTTREPVAAREREVTTYTCSRCGDPCGDDEVVRGYDVRAAKIGLFADAPTATLVLEGASGRIDVRLGSRIRVYSTEGVGYPDGGERTSHVIDTCRACFESAAIPALVEAGFVVRVEEVDW